MRTGGLATPLRPLSQSLSKHVQIGCDGRILFGPFDGLVEHLFCGRLVEPQLVIGDDARGSHQPNAVFDLFYGYGPSGMLFAERNLSAGADGFYLSFHVMPSCCMVT
jgi:hypothetical protein